ncbi:hypothetical protein LTR37_008361 [Vermiconidia calcicola]|uniref:Uncharacterized protein n=1 Tax=Vermiconidia calcicola TaxID=1690605 RepID=A0ACC3NAZ6_9PEZI|nr:hypothetical protein LTR37_008361 [Vermiconidia calcicola]
MSRGFAAAGVGLATVLGVLSAYSTFRPELEKQQAERLGKLDEFRKQHASDDYVISQAISSDLKEAREQVRGESKGFAWGIREAIWGQAKGKEPDGAVEAGETPLTSQQTGTKSSDEAVKRDDDANKRSG